jgi:P4 family phage/plasmid primase-like protien
MEVPMTELNDTYTDLTSNINCKEISTMNEPELTKPELNGEPDIQPSRFDDDDTPANTGKTIPSLLKMSPLMPSPLIPAILNADPMLAADVKNRADADEERRIERLRENGAQGGRPRIERTLLAQQCIDAEFAKHGQLLLRYYRGGWYQYLDGCFVPMVDDDVKMKVSGWLISSKAADVSASIVNDILVNLKSNVLCGLPQDKYTMPCFISTGESAFEFISMKNGIINIDEIADAMEKGLTPPAPRPHTPDLFSTVRLPFVFDPTATCPKFETYLEGVQPKSENREILQMLAGLLLTSDMRYNVAFFIYGESGTGKTIFMDILECLVGTENCCCVPLAIFGNKFGTADLTEKKANLCDEAPIIPETGRFSDIESVFKAVANGRPINVQRKGVEPWTANATAHCVFASNNLPTLTDRSNGVWDRMRIIPFNVKFRGTDRQDLYLFDKLKAELPGILNWALRGLVKLHALTSDQQEKKTFPQCAEGAALLAKMREESDREQKFLREETKTASSDTYLGALKMYDNYKSWAERRGYRAVGYDKFRDAVLRVYPNIGSGRKIVDGRKDTVFFGIDWIPDHPGYTTAAIPIILPGPKKPGCASDEGDRQPDLGF